MDCAVVRMIAAVLCIGVIFFCGGCIDSADRDSGDVSYLAGNQFLVTVNGDAGAGTGSYSIIWGDKVYKSIASFNTSDLGVTVWNDSIFIFGKYLADWLARFELDNPDKPVFQYSTIEGAEGTMNPSCLVIVNNNVGYVFRYGSSLSWIIDPSPADEPSFKLGEIDLSAYETGGNSPNPVQAIVSGNTMYVLLERSNFWAYDVDALLLTVDISTPDTPVIDDAFPLIVRSPNNMQLVGNNIYIAGWGILGFAAGDQTPTGGIERVDISGGAGSYTSALIVDDDDGSNTFQSPYTYGGATTDIALISATEGFIYFQEWNVPVNKVYPFNPTTGAVDTSTTLLHKVSLSKIRPNPDGNVTAAASFVSKKSQAGVYTIRFSAFLGDYGVMGPVSVGLEPYDFSYNN